MAKKDSSAKVAYLVFLLIAVVGSILLRLYGSNLVINFASFSFGCTGPDEFSTRCLGIQAVYRVSLGSAFFFLLMSIITCCVPAFHRGFWCLKFPLYVALIVACFFIPNQAMLVYGDISKFVSGAFLLLQIVILVDFAYDLSEYLLAKAEEADGGNVHESGLCSNKYKILYVGGSFSMLLLAIVGVIVLYATFPLTCPINVASISITWITALGYVCFSISDKVNKGLLAPSVVFIYCTFLNWGAISSNKDTQCNPSVEDPTAAIIGLVIASFSLVYTVFTSTNSVFFLFNSDKRPSEEEAKELEVRKKKVLDQVLTTDKVKIDVDDIEKGKKTGKESSGKDEEEPVEVAIWFFHLIMAIGSVYMAMLLSNWGEIDNTASTTNRSVTSMWVKVASEWITILLFFWTCVAPICFPNRDFTDGHNSMK